MFLDIPAAPTEPYMTWVSWFMMSNFYFMAKIFHYLETKVLNKKY